MVPTDHGHPQTIVRIVRLSQALLGGTDVVEVPLYQSFVRKDPISLMLLLREGIRKV
jgi:hypothetical protein